MESPDQPKRMSPEDAGAPGRGLMALLEDVAELKVLARSAAMLAVITDVVAMLCRKGLLDDADIDRMLRKLDAQAAAMSATAPDTSKCLADAALSLRDAFVEEKGKPN